MDEYTVSHNPERMRYELRKGDLPIGFADAIPRGDAVVVPHVEISPEFEGQGLGSKLVRGMLDDLRAHGKKVEPVCPFVVAFFRRNPDYSDLRA